MNHKQFWVAVASYYRQTLPDVTVAMYAKDLEHIPIDTLMELFSTYRKDSRNKFPPMPAWFIEQLNPETRVDPKLLAIELARRIDKAVKDHGSSWDEGYWSDQGNYWESKGTAFLCFEDACRHELGDVGFKAVMMRGGWKSLRQAANDMSEGTFIAQMRDDLIALITNAQAGVDVTRLGMPDQRPLELEQSKISMLASSLKTI